MTELIEKIAADLPRETCYHGGSRLYKSHNSTLDIEAFGVDKYEAEKHLTADIAKLLDKKLLQIPFGQNPETV